VKRGLRETLPAGDTLAVADFLLEVVPTDSTERGSLLPELLQHEDTGFTLINVRAFIDHWDNLLPAEHDAVRALVTGARKDRQWIRAAALTRRSVPPSLVEDLCQFWSPPELFEDEALFSMVLSRVHPDGDLLVQLQKSVEGFSELITTFYASPERTPRLIWTHDLVLDRLKKLGAPKDLQKQVSAARDAAFERRTNSFRVERDIDGEDWTFSHRAARPASDKSKGSSE